MSLLPQLYNFRLAFWTLFMFWSALSRYVEEEEKIQSHHVISKVSKKYLMWVWMAGEPTDFSTPASVFVDGWKYLWHNTSACDFIIWFGGFLNRSFLRAENEQWVLFLSFACIFLFLFYLLANIWVMFCHGIGSHDQWSYGGKHSPKAVDWPFSQGCHFYKYVQHEILQFKCLVFDAQ